MMILTIMIIIMVMKVIPFQHKPSTRESRVRPPTITILLKLGLFLVHFLTLSCTSVIHPSSSCNNSNDDDGVDDIVDDDTSEEMITEDDLVIEGFGTKIWLFLVTPCRQHYMICVNDYF